MFSGLVMQPTYCNRGILIWRQSNFVSHVINKKRVSIFDGQHDAISGTNLLKSNEGLHHKTLVGCRCSGTISGKGRTPTIFPPKDFYKNDEKNVFQKQCLDGFYAHVVNPNLHQTKSDQKGKIYKTKPYIRTPNRENIELLKDLQVDPTTPRKKEDVVKLNRITFGPVTRSYYEKFKVCSTSGRTCSFDCQVPLFMEPQMKTF